MLANWAEKKRVTPQMDTATRQKYSKFWKKAVSKTLDWVELDQGWWININTPQGQL